MGGGGDARQGATRPSIDQPFNFFFASAGTTTLVEPMSLISTVVVRVASISRPGAPSRPGKPGILPATWVSYFASTPSLIQNLAVPFRSEISGLRRSPPALLFPPCPPCPRPPRPRNVYISFSPSGVNSPV